jgi:multidrug efflux system membrane fusion protein
MGLEGETGFPHQGTINFINNKIDPYTGTITIRGTFTNPKPEKGVRLLSPGLFTRIRVPMGEPHPALLVTDRAVGTDQGLKYLYTIDKDNKIQYRRVTLGPLQNDGLRVVESGIESDDWVVVSGLQQVRPNMQVQVDRIQMPIPVPGAPAAVPELEAKPESTGGEKAKP